MPLLCILALKNGHYLSMHVPKCCAWFLLCIMWGVAVPAEATRPYDVTPIVGADFVADLYQPKGLTDVPVVIVLGGSSGGMRSARGKFLAEQGLAALTLAYFRFGGLPDTLDNIPVESVIQAIDYLQDQTKLRDSKVGIWGASRGSELAFLAATHDHRIQSVVATVPSLVAWHGARGQAAWTYRQQPIPALSFDRQAESSIRQRASQALADQDQVNKARFQFEKINGPVLLISAEQDHIWPSYPMAMQVVTYLEKQQFGFPVLHESFPTGHFFDTQTRLQINQMVVAHFKNSLAGDE